MRRDPEWLLGVKTARLVRQLFAVALLGLVGSGLIGSSLARAEPRVTARIDPPVIDELETARLTIRVSDDRDDPEVAPPDLAPLETDFEVLGTQTASRYQSVNGAVESWVDYTITLRPRRAGTLDVPALSIGGARTEALTLGVRGVPNDVRAAIDRMVFFELEISRDPVYVRAETVLTRRLYYSGDTQIYSDLPGAPEIPDVQVVPVGETQSTTAVRDGMRYGVIEQRYALFPATAGELRIPPIALTASVRLMLGGTVRRTGARVRSPERTVNVLPIPPTWPRGTPWLPATDVSITDRWTPDTRAHAVGEAIERTIEIGVAGNLAAAIPPPPDALPPDLLRQYPEPAALEDDRTGVGVTGRRRSRSSLLAVAAGAATVQPVTVTWWDVQADTLRVSVGPTRSLTLVGAPPRVDDGTAAQNTDENANADTETGDRASIPTSASAEGVDAGWVRASITALDLLLRQHAVGLALGLALLVGAALWWRKDSLRAGAATFRRTVHVALAAVGLAGTTRGLARQRALRVRARSLFDALERHDAAGALAALEAWLLVRYPLQPNEGQNAFRRDGGGWLLDTLVAARFGPPGRNPLPAATTARGLLSAVAATNPGAVPGTGDANAPVARSDSASPARYQTPHRTLAPADGLPPLFDGSA